MGLGVCQEMREVLDITSLTVVDTVSPEATSLLGQRETMTHRHLANGQTVCLADF